MVSGTGWRALRRRPHRVVPDGCQTRTVLPGPVGHEPAGQAAPLRTPGPGGDELRVRACLIGMGVEL